MKLLKLVALVCLAPLLAFANITPQTDKVGPVIIAGSPQVIPTTFPFQQASDLLVLDSGQSGVTHDPALVLTLGSDYTVTGGGYNAATQMQGGSVSVVSTGSHSVATGDRIVIMRNVPINQTSSFAATGPLTIALIEQALDKTATLSQQVNELAQRSLHFENFETNSGLMPLSARKNCYLFFDANGNLTWSAGTGQGGQGVYTAGTGLLLASNVFSVNPVQNLTTLTVTNPISGAITGNAATATALAAPRAINGVSFDGTAAITVPAAATTLTGSSLAAGVTTAPGLLSASVGTFGTLAIQNATSVAITGGAITGMPLPTLGSDVATKTYVDNNSVGIVQRTGVAVTTTANITLSGEQTIDGVLTSASRVLVKNESTTANNGIYVTAAGAWSRASDSNTAGQLKVGYYYFVSSGTTQGATGWTIQTAPTVLGTDPVVFGQFSASTTYTAGTGILLSGNAFSVNPAQSGLTITGSAFNGTVGATTPAAGTFTTTIASGNAFMANLVVKAGQLDEQITNGLAAVQFNYDGYNGGTTQFRDTEVYDGKNGLVARFTGSTKGLTVIGPITGTITGNADTATALQTGRTIAITGDLTYTSPSFNGTANVSAAGTLVTVASAGTTGSSTAIPVVTINAKGLTTAITTAAVVAPAGTLTGSTLAAGVTASSLTSVGTLGSLAVTGLTAGGTFSASSNANIRTTKGNFNVVLNVKDYGAKGDGSTDDSAAIQAAIAALPSAYGSLYFPAGRYIYSSGTTMDFSSKTHLAIYGYGAELYDNNSAAGRPFVFVEGSCSYVDMHGLMFNGNAASRVGGNHMVMFNANYSHIYDCTFTNAAQFAFYIGQDTTTITTNVLVSNCTFINTWADGIHINNANYIQVFGCGFENTGDDSIGLVRDSLSDTSAPTQIAIIGCNIKRAGYGSGGISGMAIRVDEASDVLIDANLIDFNYQAGIEVDRFLSTTAYNARIVISNNKLINCDQHAGELASINLRWVQGAKVFGNKIDDPANGGGISFLDCSDLTIDNNDFRNIPNRMILSNDSTTTNVAANCFRIDITNNHCLYSTVNQAIYVVAPPGTTINDLIISGNFGHTLPAGDWIYYDRITTGRITNNTRTGTQTITAGGTVSGVTTANNN